MSSNTEQIKEKLSIVDVISSYIKVEKAGINFKARCPFHNEKTPSFFISPTRQSFYCFGCGEKGDIFSFVEKFEGLDFRGALQTLADRAGVKLEKFGSQEVYNKNEQEKERLFAIMEEATKFFEVGLKKSESSIKYLQKRGLTEESIQKWRLGFAEDRWRDLHDHLLAKGFSKEEMLSAGLLKKLEGEEKFYDTFRHRIMFPICDAAGRVIAFSGRSLKDPSTSSGQENKTPKYLNSPETKLFYKSEVLYGFNIAKNYIRKMDYAVLVEGQLDLIMSHQAKVLNTVASSGTALTELHLKKIQKLTNRIIIGYDADSAGEKAATRASEIALPLGMEVKIASLPKDEDPASVIKQDTEKWKEALKNSEHFTDYILNKAVKENEGRNLTREILKNILPIVPLIQSEIEKTQFVKKIASKIKVREDDIWQDLKGLNPKSPSESKNFDPELKQVDLEQLLTGLIFLEESNGGDSALKLKWQEILGAKEVAERLTFYGPRREALIFTAEMHASSGDFEKTKEEIIKRTELMILKQKLQKAADLFDKKDVSENESEEAKGEFEKIQKRIKELSN